jgi:hypothetical protein
LGRKWDGGLLTSGHADGPQLVLVMEARPSEAATLLDPLGRVKCTEGAATA